MLGTDTGLWLPPKRSVRRVRAMPLIPGPGVGVGFGPDLLAGGAAPFNFLDPTLGTCQLLLDATDLTTLQASPVSATPVANGVNVGRWADKSGNARHCDQTTAGQQPKRNDGSIGGQTSLLWAATNRLVSPSFAVAQPHTIYVVGYTASSSDNIYTCDGASANTLIRALGSTTMDVYSGAALDQTVTNTATPAVMCGLFNGASSVNRYNATEVSGSSGTGAIGAGLVIGDYYTGGFSIVGGIGFVAVYSGAHTLSQRNTVQGALKAIWGTP